MKQNQDSEIKGADVDPTELPDNAFRELAPGEEYRPVMHPERNYAEVTPYSVTVGLILAVIFSAAAAYLGLKVGQVFEAAIPIAIIAVGLSGALKKKDALGQNVIIQSIFTSGSLHFASHLPRHHCQFLPNLLVITARRRVGHLVLHSFPQIFREGYARQIPVPGGHSYYTGAH
jgi:hypothetical protein